MTLTDLQRLQKEKFINFLAKMPKLVNDGADFQQCLTALLIAKMPKLVNDGADFQQCLTALLEDADWCYINNDEYKILTDIHTYLSSK